MCKKGSKIKRYFSKVGTPKTEAKGLLVPYIQETSTNVSKINWGGEPSI